MTEILPDPADEPFAERPAVMANDAGAVDALPGPAPVEESLRINSIDVLRGVAVLGILILNIQSFAMPSAAYVNPLAYGDLHGANFWIWFFSQVFADQKFMTIFSMLFGAGIVLMTGRIESRGVPSSSLHYRRMAWLVLFGALHGYLLWYGDILYMYGVCGMLVYPLRRLRPMPQIAIGIMVVAVASILSLAEGYAMYTWSPEDLAQYVDESWQPTEAALHEEIEANRAGFIEQIQHRAPTTYFFQTGLFMLWGVWRAGGLMLMGMGLFKLGVFSGERSARFYRGLIALALVIGVPIVLYGLARNFQEQWSAPYAFFIGSQYNYWASILIALGWVGAVMLVCKSRRMRKVARVLAPVGRMALTNYLMQTIICTFIFNGQGFGYFGDIDRAGQAMIVVAIWAFQIIASSLWMRFFRFGPFEWMWRSLTYWRIQPVWRGSQADSITPRSLTG